MGFIRLPEEGELVWALGALVNGKATSEQTRQRYELIEHTGPQGYASPLHTHLDESESFYILEGQVTMVVGDEEVKATAGTFAFVEPGDPHAFRVDSPTARFLMLVSPPRLLPFFAEVGEQALSATLPPPPEGPLDVERLAEIATRHGMEILGPPPGVA